MNYLLLFFAGLLTDLFLGLWNLNLSKERYFLSVLFTILTGICSIIFIWECKANDIYGGLLWLLGLGIGTVIAIKFQKYINSKL